MTKTINDLICHGEAEGGEKYRGYSVNDPLSDKGWSQMWGAQWGSMILGSALFLRQW